LYVFELKDRSSGFNFRCGRPVGYQNCQGHGQGFGEVGKAVEIDSATVSPGGIFTGVP